MTVVLLLLIAVLSYALGSVSALMRVGISVSGTLP